MSRYPGIETRLALYHRVLLSVARALIFLAAAIALLQLWGLGALDWLMATQLGRRVLSSLVTLSVTRAAGAGGLGSGQRGDRAASGQADPRGAGGALGAAAHVAAVAAHDCCRSPS